MARVKRTDRTAFIARNLVDRGTQASPESYSVVVSLNATSTAAANAVWQNPHPNIVFVHPKVAVSVAGTGTFTLGTGTGGTGSSVVFMAAGTLALGVQARFTFAGTVAASATAGNTDLSWVPLAASGSGGDSVVIQVTDGVASTAVAYLLIDVINPVA